MPETFKTIASRTGKSVEWLKTPEGQEYAVEDLMKANAKDLKAIGVPPTATNLYIAHQLGIGRAKRYFTNSLTNKDITLMWKNLGKPTDISKTDREAVITAWNDKFKIGD